MSTKHGSDQWIEGETSSAEEISYKEPISTKSLRHCSRWWWLYLLLVVLVVVLITMPIIFVAIPHTLQNQINQATMTVDYESVTAPLAESFDFMFNTTIESHTSHKAIINTFNASYYLLDTKPNIKPFVYTTFPTMELAPVSHLDFTIKQQRVADIDQFTEFNKAVLLNETVTFGIQGMTQVKADGLPSYPLKWDKTVKMKGLNKLAGLYIHDIELLSRPAFDGATMIGKVDIPNPTVINVQLGNVTVNVSTQNGTYLGHTLLEYVQLYPGNNTYDMRGYLNNTLALEHANGTILDLRFFGNGSVDFIGQEISYLSKAMQAYVINYRLNLTEAETHTNGTSS